MAPLAFNIDPVPTRDCTPAIANQVIVWPGVTKIVLWTLKDERRAADNAYRVSRLRDDNGELP